MKVFKFKYNRFILSFLLTSGISILFFLFVAFVYIPSLHVEEWLRDVLICKKDIALRTPSPKVIILSGSNAFWGMRSDILEKELNRSVVNLAFHASFSLYFYPCLLKDILNEGDVVVMPLELDHYSMESPWNKTSIPAYLGFGKSLFDIPKPWEPYLNYTFSYIWNYEFIYGMFRNLKNPSYLRQLYLPTVQGDSCVAEFRAIKDNPVPTRLADVYNYLNMTSRGDINWTRNLEASIQPKKIRCEVSQEFLSDYRRLEEMVLAHKASIYLVWPVLWDSDNMEELSRLRNSLQKNSITLHGNPEEMQFPVEAFSDTYYHLKMEYAEERTRRLLPCLKKLIELDK